MTEVMNFIIDRYRKLTPGTRKFFACFISLTIALCTMQMVMRPAFALSNDEDTS